MKRPDLVRYLEEALPQDDGWGGGRLHISDLAYGTGELCDRQLKLRLEGAKRKPYSLGTRMMFDNGHRLQDRMLELVAHGLLADGWYVADDRGAVSLDGIGGEFDWMLERGDITVIVDVKTVRGNAFRRKDPFPKETNIAQLRGYMMATDATYGLLLYVDREGSNHPQGYIVERDDGLVREYIDHIRGVEADDELPPILDNAMVTDSMPRGPVGANRRVPGWRPPESQSYMGGKWYKSTMAWQCQYCQYQGTSCPVAFPVNEWEVIEEGG